MSGSEALKAVAIVPVPLKAKEGLALTSGTQTMTAVAALMVHDATNEFGKAFS
jgi:histidine ammonia-lyase